MLNWQATWLTGHPRPSRRWNPFGRFLCLAGFGNLPGDIVFYDKKADGKCKQMASVRQPAVSCSWSPDGRYLLTATTAPRLRVDNNVRIFTYCGEWSWRGAGSGARR